MQECIDDLQCDVIELQREVNDLCRMQRLSDAVITGVPCTSTVTPKQLVSNISSVLGHNLSAHTVAFRAKGKQGRNSSANAPIIVKFTSHNEQQAFLQKFRAFKRLKLNQINSGFASDAVVGAFESLTPYNFKILRAAIKLRGQKLHSVHTRQGLVFVRKTADAVPVKVKSVDALSELILDADTDGTGA